MTETPVELFQGFYWDCPACSTRNWTEGQKVPPDVAERAVRDELDLDEDEEIPPDTDSNDMVMVPDEVRCCKCGQDFPVLGENDEDEAG
jgi:hypothetical protein